MATENNSLGGYVGLALIVTMIGLVLGVFLANYIFIVWQKIPQEYYSYKTIWQYKQTYGDVASVSKAIKVSVAVGFVPAVLLNIFLAVSWFMPQKREQYGSARFANMPEIRKTGLIQTAKQRKKLSQKKPSNPSVLVGKYQDKLLEFFGNEFVFVAAPTRSGKGVGIVIPNLLHYPDSVVVLDVKNENWDLTAGFRSKYQDCFLFAPKAENGCTHRYNPLDYIDRDETKRMADIQNIANILYPTSETDGNTAYFNSQAQRLFTGFVLYMLETPERPCSMAELIKLSTPSVPLHEWIVEKIDKRKETEQALSVECVEALMTFAGNSSDNTRAGISSSMMSPLFIFTDPMVAAATSTSDFRLDEVRRKRMSIYVGIQPNELARFDKVLNLFFSQLINLNTRVLPEQDPSLKYQCLVLLDEFTALGRVDIINKSVAYIAGYNMRLMLIFQNRGQAEQYYGKEGTQTMLSNMACQVIFAPREPQDADSYSKLLGTQTIKGRSISRNRGKGGGGSVSTSDQSRALMLPQEMMELDESKQIIKHKANKPILCEKIIFHEDETFLSRLSTETDTNGRRKGLPIQKRCQPPKVDVHAMLEVMRGVEHKKVENVEGLPTAKKLITENRDYLERLSEALGFSADFLDLDNYDAAA